MLTKVKAFLMDEEGASAVEYGLLVAGIAIAALVAIQAVGTNLSQLFTDVAGNLTSS
ncbi:MAG: Flp family type IVb pilin [Desulfobaccales bacterium]